MANSFMPELRNLTEKLSFSSKETYSPSIRQNTMIKGTSLSFGLLNEPAISCAKVFMSAGSMSPLHAHDETEMFLVYKGIMEVTVAEQVHILNVGDCLEIDPGVEHEVLIPEGDCWLLAITIPQTTGWPQAPKGV